jgi:hypothetical protein
VGRGTVPRTGDVIEIATSGGYAYALYSHRNSEYGCLLRVWNDRHAQPLRDFGFMSVAAPSFSTFYLLGPSVRHALTTIVGNIPVPASLSEFPLFRAGGIPDPQTGKVDNWWLWDGEKEWRVGEITAEQRQLPIRGVVNHAALVGYIERAWTPPDDPR